MKLTKIYLALLVFMLITAGCESLLDSKSDRILLPNQHQLNSPNDTLYSMIGIFSQLEKLADRYVLLGELRGDLTDIIESAEPELLEIYNLEISEDNPYNQIEDYYSIVNNCNYIIQNIDTAQRIGVEKVLYKEFAAAKAIRAWTYMQVALNYGTVKYYDQPITTIGDGNDFTEYSLQELLPVLIQDLEPWKDIDAPGGVNLGENFSSSITFFPIHFVLGDLYLWNGEYENAAVEYHSLMEKQKLVNNTDYQVLWEVENNEFTNKLTSDKDWRNQFLSEKDELISVLAGPVEVGQLSYIEEYKRYSNLIPSDIAINNWDKQTYYHTAKLVKNGDLRGDMESYLPPETSELSYGQTVYKFSGYNTNQIAKYLYLAQYGKRIIPVYRTASLYLRYAEAVNRAGKPNMAFAVLKHGLNSKTMAVDSIVPKSEKYISFTDSTGTFYNYANFEDVTFDQNIGIHARGCGKTNLALDYKIPSQTSFTDSIIWVEDKIIEELALETAFEGNRFQDLMRISFRRGDPAYLADIVSEKYDDKAGMRSILMDENNWYLP